MPTAAPSACLEPGCDGYAVARGRCALHRPSEAQRGYGTAHNRERRAAMSRGVPRCEGCGTTRQPLHRDHRIPVSLGGTQAAANKRWLCVPCHGRLGVRSDRGGRCSA